MGEIHINSFKSVQIEVLSYETKASLGFASGFICRYKEKYFLLTNWHVVSGKNFESKEIIHPSGAIPGFFNLSFQAANNKTETTLQPVFCKIANLILYDYRIEDKKIILGNTPLWVEHPDQGSKVDIAVIEITTEIVEKDVFKAIAYEIEKESTNPIQINVMDNVFIIGYPLKSSTTPNTYPIYKGATIASEPNMYNDLPMFYVDGKTKKGMSGSPVVVREKLNITQDAGKINFNEGAIHLIGIYSGRERQADDEYEAELGIVWRINECILPTLEKAYTEDKANKSLKGTIGQLIEKAKTAANNS